MGFDLMRLRTLIELLAALILTFAALAAVTKMAKTTGMNVEKAYAWANTGAVYVTLDNAGGEPNKLCCTATTLPGTQTHDAKPSRMELRLQN